MEALLATLTGSPWGDIVELLKSYWIVPVGAVVLFQYGQFHFNTPDYALTGHEGESGRGLIRNAPMARPHLAAPPIFTTARVRYRRFALEYVLVLEILFLLVTLCPDLVAYAAKIENAKISLSGSVGERAIWALFVLTGLLSSLPVFKDIDGWLLRRLHQRAAIPDDARLTASTLHDAEFKPQPEVAAAVRQDFQTRSMRAVTSGKASGTLEAEWFKVRCLHEQLRRVLQSNQPGLRADKYREFRRRFGDELDEIKEIIEQQRAKLLMFMTDQDAMLSGDVTDIDLFYEKLASDPNLRSMVERRNKQTFQVHAIFYRMCLFSSLLVYATEVRPEAMGRMFTHLGFAVTVTFVPPVDWAAIIKVVACVFAVILVPSYFYTIILAGLGINSAPSSYGRMIPLNLGTASFWSLIGVSLHTAALIIASKLKRRYILARGESAASERAQIVENVRIAAWCFAATYLMLLGIMFVNNNSNLWRFNPWPLLPATTAFFVGLYIDRALAGQRTSLRHTLVQGLVMFVLAGAVCLIYLPDDASIMNYPPVLWLFALYASLTAAAIGLSVGFVFQGSYSMQDLRPAASPSLAVPRVVVAAVPATNPLAALAGDKPRGNADPI